MSTSSFSFSAGDTGEGKPRNKRRFEPKSREKGSGRDNSDYRSRSQRPDFEDDDFQDPDDEDFDDDFDDEDELEDLDDLDDDDFDFEDDDD